MERRKSQSERFGTDPNTFERVDRITFNRGEKPKNSLEKDHDHDDNQFSKPFLQEEKS